jgi:DNA-binding transcriptional MerR regulator
MLRLYTKNEVNSIFSHIPSRTLRSWVEGGLVGWAGEKTDGRGVHRSFTIGNLYQIAIVAELTSLHFPLKTIQNLMEQYFQDVEEKGSAILNCINKMLIISIGTVERKERFPYYRSALIPKEEASKSLPYFLEPTDYLIYSQYDKREILERRGKRPPNPSILIVINLSEIMEKIHCLIEKAELG